MKVENSGPDARTLCPSPPARRIHTLLPFKLALAKQFGIEEGFRVYREMLNLPDSFRIEQRRLEPLRAFCERRAISMKELYRPGESYDIEPPAVVGDGYRRTMRGTSRSFYVACLPNARVQPHSALVQVGEAALLDYEEAEFEGFDDNLELDPCIFAATGREAWIIRDERAPIEIEEAFGALIGPRSHHFGHWLWEYLPKYLTAVRSGALPPVPVLINSELGESLREALRLLLPEGASIIEVPSTPFSALAPVRVRRLWTAPCLFYEPYFEKYNERYAGPDHRCFPASRFEPALAAMQAAAAADTSPAASADRLYLARRAHLHRKLLNRDEIESLVESRGFEIFYPEGHSFQEQVRAIRRARYIMGPEGSAMYLIFFANAGTKLCILNPPYTLDTLTYSYLIRAAGVDVTLVTPASNGQAYARRDRLLGPPQHEDFSIDEGVLARFLDTWLEKP